MNRKLAERIRLLDRIEARSRPLTARIAKEIDSAAVQAVKSGHVYIPTSGILDTLADQMAAAYITRYQHAKRPNARLSFVSDTKKAARQIDLDFDDLRNSFRSRIGPTVTKASAYWTERINTALSDITQQQLPTRQAVREMRRALHTMGLSPTNASRAETLVRTHSQMAFGAAQWKLNQDDPHGLIKAFQFFTAGDDRVRPEHQAIDGTILLAGDPRLATLSTPLGWNCRCQWIEITDEVEATNLSPNVAATAVDDGFDINWADLVD